MHQHWLQIQASERGGASMAGNTNVETRFRYNPMSRACRRWCRVIPLLLHAAGHADRAGGGARKTGSITNLCVTPVTRIEFLLGEAACPVGLAAVNFLLMSLLAVTVFGVPVKGSFFTWRWPR